MLTRTCLVIKYASWLIREKKKKNREINHLMVPSQKSLECQFEIIHHASLLLPFEWARNGIRYSDGKIAIRLAIPVIFFLSSPGLPCDHSMEQAQCDFFFFFFCFGG